MTQEGEYTAYNKGESDKIQRILDEAGASYTMSRRVSHDQRDGKLIQTVFRFNVNTMLRALIKKQG